MAEAVRNVIIISVCLGICSLLPLETENAKYVKHIISAVLAVACIIPLIRGVMGIKADFPNAEFSPSAESANELIVEKCRERLEKDIISFISSKYGDGFADDVKLKLNSEDIENIIIERVTIYGAKGTSAERETLRSSLSELLYTDKEKIIITAEVSGH